MKKEVIDLTDAAIYPELIKLLESKGERIWGPCRKWSPSFRILAYIEGIGWGGSSAYITTTDSQFLQKYGENTAPEPAPAWTFKTDDNLKSFVAGFLSGNFANFEEYVNTLRKPSFELVTADNVRVTDPEQWVWMISSDGPREIQAAKALGNGYQCFTTEQAAHDYRRNNTPAIKLSDMTLSESGDLYWISKEHAHNLVNERINGK